MWAFSPYLEPWLPSVELVLSCRLYWGKILVQEHRAILHMQMGGVTNAPLFTCHSHATEHLQHPKRTPPSASSFLPGPVAGSHNLLPVTTALPLLRCRIQEILGCGTRVFPCKMSLRSPPSRAPSLV